MSAANVVVDSELMVPSVIELGILGNPVAVTKLAGREIVDAGIVIAAGRFEGMP